MLTQPDCEYKIPPNSVLKTGADNGFAPVIRISKGKAANSCKDKCLPIVEQQMGKAEQKPAHQDHMNVIALNEGAISLEHKRTVN